VLVWLWQQQWQELQVANHIYSDVSHNFEALKVKLFTKVMESNDEWWMVVVAIDGRADK